MKEAILMIIKAIIEIFLSGLCKKTGGCGECGE